MDRAVGVVERSRQLGSRQSRSTDRLVEGALGQRLRRKRPAPVLVRVEDPDGCAQVSAYELDRRFQVAVVRNHDCDVVARTEAVNQQIARQVHVGALRLGVPDEPVGGTASGRSRQAAVDLSSQEVAKMDAEIGDCRQRSQISLLPLCLLWIARPWLDFCREISDSSDFMSWLEKVATKRR